METQTIGSTPTTSGTQNLVSNEMLGKEDFLKLLVAQLRYQDPLEPMEDQEFVAQLAQFSSLEQLQNMNDSLSQNVEWDMVMSQTINNTMATSLIGKEVVAGSNSVGLGDDGSAEIVFKAADYVHQGTVTIYNSEGAVVRTLAADNLPAGEQRLAWDGRDSNGNELQAGNYFFDVSLYDANGEAVTSQGYLVGIVDGVKYIEGQAYLDVDGALVPLSDVMEINSQD